MTSWKRSTTPAVLAAAISLALLAMPVRSDSPAAPRPGVLSPGVEALRAAQPRSLARLWVFFADKGYSSPAEEARAASRLPVLSAGRRPARVHAPDSHDLPVAERYVAAVRALGATLRQTTRWLNGVSVEAPLSAVDRLAALPFVSRIELVRAGRRPPFPEPMGDAVPPVEGRLATPAPTPASPSPIGPMTSYPAEEALFYGASFNQDSQIGIVALHRLGYTGAGVTIVILDSGFQTSHQALAGRRLIAQHDFVFHDNNVNNEAVDWPSAWDHGTATWSNVGGFKPGALVGGAFEANFILAKTEDIRSETQVEEDNYVAALEWADSLGADIASASLIYLTFDSPPNYTYADLDGNTTVTARAVDIAVARGMAVVNAVGNGGPGFGTLGTPADADSVLSVGAVDSLGTVASFSSRGPTSDGRIKPEVVARGVRDYVALTASPFFGPASGTSFSTPLTAGTAALLLEAHPTWTGWDLREAVRSTASHHTLPDNITGWGLVTATAALNLSPRTAPRVSLPFALIAPTRGSVVNTAVPALRWERSLAGAPGDNIQYRVILSTHANFAPADTYSAGPDTTWSPPFFLTPGSTYYWNVVAKNLAGWNRQAYMTSRFTVSSTVDAPEVAAVSAVPRIGPARPNPMDGATRVPLSLPRLSAGSGPAPYSVEVYAADGRLVRRLARGTWGPDARTDDVAWDGRDASGQALPAGVYFISLDVPGRRSTAKVVMSRRP